MSRKNRKKISYSFTIPIPAISEDKGRLFVKSAGELLICAKARINPPVADLPVQFLDKKGDEEIKIIIESVHFAGVDILPVLNLPEAKALLVSIDKAAYSSLLHIKNYE
jgi:hypothetical protein